MFGELLLYTLFLIQNRESAFCQHTHLLGDHNVHFLSSGRYEPKSNMKLLGIHMHFITHLHFPGFLFTDYLVVSNKKGIKQPRITGSFERTSEVRPYVYY